MFSIKPGMEYHPASCFLCADDEVDTVRARIDEDGDALGDVCCGCIERILREPEKLPDTCALDLIRAYQAVPQHASAGQRSRS